MRHPSLFTRIFVGAAPLILTLGFGAHAKPKKDVESSKIKTTVPIKVGDIETQNRTNRTAVGEKFRLWFSINPTDCNDPILLNNAGKDDHDFEGYGELRVNDKVEWKVIRADAHMFRIKHLDLPSNSGVDPRRQGYSLNKIPTVIGERNEIKFDTSKGRIARISLRLKDKDDPLAGYDYDRRDQTKADRQDDLIGDFKIELDLSKLGKSDGRYYWFWGGRDESGNAIGTNLHLFVEHVGTTYGSTSGGINKPTIDPKIIDKKFPGKIPVPGPIVTKPAPSQ